MTATIPSTRDEIERVRARGWGAPLAIVVPTTLAEATRLRSLGDTACKVDAHSIRRLGAEDRLGHVEREIQEDATRRQAIQRQARTASPEEAVTLAAELRGIELRAAGLESRRREIVAEVGAIDREIQAAKENGHSARRSGEHAMAIAAQCLADIATKEDEIRRLQSTAEGQARVAKIAFAEAIDFLGTSEPPPMSEADRKAALLNRHDEERGR